MVAVVHSVGGVLHNSLHSLHVIVMNALLCPEVITFPAHVQQVYLHSAFKVFVGSTKCCSEVDLAYIISLIRARSDLFKQVIPVMAFVQQPINGYCVLYFLESAYGSARANVIICVYLRNYWDHIG